MDLFNTLLIGFVVGALVSVMVHFFALMIGAGTQVSPGFGLLADLLIGLPTNLVLGVVVAIVLIRPGFDPMILMVFFASMLGVMLVVSVTDYLFGFGRLR